MADYTLQGIDSRLWRKVKALAAIKGITIKQLIINLLTEAITKTEAP